VDEATTHGADGADRDGKIRGRLADVVHDQLRRLIQRGEYARGLKLPAENDLAKRFGVSRPVVREALARLRDEGFVSSQKGSGTVVTHAADKPAHSLGLPPIATMADLVRFYEFRIGVEGVTAALAAERRTLSHLQAMEVALTRAEEMIAAGLFELLADTNFDFHRAIGHATRNPYHATTIETLPNFVGRNMLDKAGAGASGADERARRIHGEHQAIFSAILGGDAHRARVEMERHILAARDAVMEGQALGPSRGGP
jgi:GntR family transcriptional regulator, transcriptional repressor for pyruvate dehydrogenase complex